MSGIFQPVYPYQPTPLHICSIGRFSPVSWGLPILGSTASTGAAWPANNLAIYTPIALPTPCVLARFWVLNGTNATGNVDVGIYTVTGTLISSTGTTARAGTSVVQYINVTDRLILAGQYYLALVGSSTTGTYGRGGSFSNADRARTAGGLLEEVLGSTVLPSTMTPVSYTRTDVFQFGFTQSATL